jgi:hypothetical protein
LERDIVFHPPPPNYFSQNNKGHNTVFLRKIPNKSRD